MQLRHWSSLVARYFMKTTYTRRKFSEMLRQSVEDRIRRLEESKGDFSNLPVSHKRVSMIVEENYLTGNLE
jgi:hypothetical protein